MKYKFIIWGLGAVYNRVFNCLKYFEVIGEIEIVAVTDIACKRCSYVDDYPVIMSQNITKVEYDYIVIMSDNSFSEIQEELMEMGVDSTKIMSYRFLQIPNVNLQRYIKLKNSKVSIVSNSCWGGVTYKTLGLECLSPFKNLFIKDNEYLKLIGNLKHYLSLEPIPYKYVYEKGSNIQYPVLLLDDILLHCNHDTNAEEAILKWNRRNKKFNYQNIFIEMYTCSENVADEFVKLKQYSKKVCFVPFNADNPFLMKLEMNDKYCEFWEVVISNAFGEKNSLKYNPVDLLLMEKCLRSV